MPLKAAKEFLCEIKFKSEDKLEMKKMLPLVKGLGSKYFLN